MTGYEFRLAGYRLPDEIGQKSEANFNLGDFFAARTQTQYEAKDSTGKIATNQLTFKEFTMYPLTGSWGENFGSLVELSMAPGEGFEVENAFVRGVYGDQAGWAQARIGVLHPWEGFGASDRPLGNIRPVFQKQQAKGATGAATSPFYLWNVDEAAFELGYYLPKTGTTVALRTGQGVIWKADAKNAADLADPAQGGALMKTSPGYPKTGLNDMSYQAFLNQTFNNDSGFSVYYYQTTTPYPNPYGNSYAFLTTTGDAPTTFTSDSFNRLAVYANWFAIPNMLNLMGGYMWGNDSIDDKSIDKNAAQSGKSYGYYGEVNYHIIENKLAAGYRYDYFNPAQDASASYAQTASTVFVNYLGFQHLNLIGDYQTKDSDQGAGKPKKTDNQFLMNLIFIF